MKKKKRDWWLYQMIDKLKGINKEVEETMDKTDYNLGFVSGFKHALVMMNERIEKEDRAILRRLKKSAERDSKKRAKEYEKDKKKLGIA